VSLYVQVTVEPDREQPAGDAAADAAAAGTTTRPASTIAAVPDLTTNRRARNTRNLSNVK
jgi:hypothetical protein